MHSSTDDNQFYEVLDDVLDPLSQQHLQPKETVNCVSVELLVAFNNFSLKHEANHRWGINKLKMIMEL
jgi:hypothetical protein